MNKFNVWNKWGKLKTVMLGDNFRSSFFKDVKNDRIRSALTRIADETQEDLENYEKVLKDFGCTVLRPEIDVNDNIMNYIDEQGRAGGPITGATTQGVPRNPLQARDTQLVIGNDLFYTGVDYPSIRKALTEYSTDCVDWTNPKYFNLKDTRLKTLTETQWNTISGADWGSYSDYMSDVNYFEKVSPEIQEEILSFVHVNRLIPAPSMTLVGRDIYVDEKEWPLLEHQIDTMREKVPNIRLNLLHHGGHSDGCFHTIKPGAILSTDEIQKYENTFPGWDVCYLPGESFHKISKYAELKWKQSKQWWVPGEEDNDQFTNFVETWLQDWVGYIEESVFDVNCLVLDEHHVCLSNIKNEQVNQFLKKHKMEPVHIPWRHRYFWDGGLHCITLDLVREGVQEDYFPDRGTTGIIDYGYD